MDGLITKYDNICCNRTDDGRIEIYMVNPCIIGQCDNIKDLLKIDENYNTIILNQKLYNHYFDKIYKLTDIEKYNIKTKLGLFINRFDFDGRKINIYINNIPSNYDTENKINNFILVSKELNYENLQSDLPFILHFCDIY